ncbi:MAG: branched-chain amino acid ABC transporter permease [Chloroflexi bacterium OHK40]
MRERWEQFTNTGSRWGSLVLVALLAVLPAVAPPYLRSLVIEVLILAIFAMSLDLLLGYTGMVSFGHAAFLGLGAYLLAFFTRSVGANLLQALPVVLLGVALFAVVAGFLALRTSGIAFLMLTLAISQMLFGLAIKWSSVTGGSDGLAVARPYVGIGGATLGFGPDRSFYYLTLASFALAWWLLRRITASPFGHALRGIKANEPRMQALGYRTHRLKLTAFVIAGLFAGVAGMLLAAFNRHASPELFGWAVSGEAIIMVIVGGSGTLVGPILGATLVHLLESYVSSYTELWRLVMGLVFVGFVLFAPQGIIGLLRRRGRPPSEVELAAAIKEPEPAALPKERRT